MNVSPLSWFTKVVFSLISSLYKTSEFGFNGSLDSLFENWTVNLNESFVIEDSSIINEFSTYWGAFSYVLTKPSTEIGSTLFSKSIVKLSYVVFYCKFVTL